MDVQRLGTKVYNIVKGKPETLGDGLKRVIRYASKGEKVPSLISMKRYGSGVLGEGPVTQVRVYSNGLTIFENTRGLVIIKNKNKYSSLQERLAYNTPFVAVNRFRLKGNIVINKFFNNLTELSTKIMQNGKVKSQSLTTLTTQAKDGVNLNISNLMKNINKIMGSFYF